MIKPKKYNCADCGKSTGTLHQSNCDIERCPKCNGQLLSCDCKFVPTTDSRFLIDINGITYNRYKVGKSVESDFFP